MPGRKKPTTKPPRRSRPSAPAPMETAGTKTIRDRGGRPLGIPERLHAWVLELAASGKTPPQISEQLAAAHGIKVTRVAVWRTLKRLKEQRAVITDAVVAEKTGVRVAGDLDILAEQLEGTRKVANALRDRLLDPRTGEPTAEFLDCIGKTPTIAVYQGIVGRVESIGAKLIEFAGGGGKGGAPPGGAATSVLVLPAEDPGA